MAKLETAEFREITKVHTIKKSLLLLPGDKNQFDFDFKLPSIDETSFMPKYLSSDEA